MNPTDNPISDDEELLLNVEIQEKEKLSTLVDILSQKLRDRSLLPVGQSSSMGAIEAALENAFFEALANEIARTHNQSVFLDTDPSTSYVHHPLANP